MNVLKFFLLGSVLFSPAASFAITCSPDDWDDAICKLPDLPGTRCANVTFFRAYCSQTTAGCESLPAGQKCFGTTPSGHWYPIVELVDGEPVPTYKCRCGCFAEETEFLGFSAITAKDLISRSKEESINIGTLDEAEGVSVTDREINGVMFSSEKEDAYTILTEKGRKIILSSAHPVVMANEDGKISEMKQAKSIKVGEYLVGIDGNTDAIKEIRKEKYSGQMINFNVKSTNPAHHIVVANELKMGDSAWQEKLNSSDSRLLYRIEILRAIEASRRGE